MERQPVICFPQARTSVIVQKGGNGSQPGNLPDSLPGSLPGSQQAKESSSTNLTGHSSSPYLTGHSSNLTSHSSSPNLSKHSSSTLTGHSSSYLAGHSSSPNLTGHSSSSYLTGHQIQLRQESSLQHERPKDLEGGMYESGSEQSNLAQIIPGENCTQTRWINSDGKYQMMNTSMEDLSKSGIGVGMMRPSIINTGHKPTENIQIQQNKDDINLQKSTLNEGGCSSCQDCKSNSSQQLNQPPLPDNRSCSHDYGNSKQQQVIITTIQQDNSNYQNRYPGHPDQQKGHQEYISSQGGHLTNLMSRDMYQDIQIQKRYSSHKDNQERHPVNQYRQQGHLANQERYQGHAGQQLNHPGNQNRHPGSGHGGIEDSYSRGYPDQDHGHGHGGHHSANQESYSSYQKDQTKCNLPMAPQRLKVKNHPGSFYPNNISHRDYKSTSRSPHSKPHAHPHYVGGGGGYRGSYSPPSSSPPYPGHMRSPQTSLHCSGGSRSPHHGVGTSYCSKSCCSPSPPCPPLPSTQPTSLTEVINMQTAAAVNPHIYNLIYKQVVADVNAAKGASTLPPMISPHNNMLYNPQQPQQSSMRTASPPPNLQLQPSVNHTHPLLPALAAAQTDEYKSWLAAKSISCMQAQGQLPSCYNCSDGYGDGSGHVQPVQSQCSHQKKYACPKPEKRGTDGDENEQDKHPRFGSMMNGYLNCGASQLQQALIRQPAIQKQQFTPQPATCFSQTNMETNNSLNDTFLAAKVSDVTASSADEDRPSVLRSASDTSVLRSTSDTQVYHSTNVSSKISRDQVMDMDESNDINENIDDTISCAMDQKEDDYSYEKPNALSGSPSNKLINIKHSLMDQQSSITTEEESNDNFNTLLDKIEQSGTVIPDLRLDRVNFEIKREVDDLESIFSDQHSLRINMSPSPFNNFEPPREWKPNLDNLLATPGKSNEKSDCQPARERKRRTKSEIEHGQDKRPISDCGVCGDKAIAHMHYGGICCYSCKAFFRRAVQSGKDKRYKCKSEGDCNVAVNNRRGCQKCRFLKCIQIGMVASWVLSDEQCEKRFGKSKLKRKGGYPNIKRETPTQPTEDQDPGLKMVGLLQKRPPSLDMAQCLVPHHMWLSSTDELIITRMSMEYELSKEVISFSEENTELWNKLFGRETSSKHDYSSTEITSLIQTVVRKNIYFLENSSSYFKKLDFEDRRKLLQKNMAQMSQLRGALRYDVRDKKFNWYFNKKEKPNVSDQTNLENKKIDEHDLKKFYSSEKAASDVMKGMERIASVGLTSEALLILMHVVVLCTDGYAEHELKKFRFIEDYQVAYFNLLHRYIYSKMDPEKATSLISKVVSLLVDLRQICEEAEESKSVAIKAASGDLTTASNPSSSSESGSEHEGSQDSTF